MKKNVLPLDLRSFLMLLSVSSFFFMVSSCSESDTTPGRIVLTNEYKCATCKTSPEALAENDNSYKGIYIGFTEKGILSIDIDNKHIGEMKASLLKNNVDRRLVHLESHSDSEKYYALFADNGESPITLEFSVMLNGDNPQIVLGDGLIFKAINKEIDIYKEKSNGMIEVFEGILFRKNINNADIGVIENKQNGYGTVLIVDPNDILASETIVLSRAKGYWSETRIYTDIGFHETVNTIYKNKGKIVGKNLMDNNNNQNGVLNSDLISGMVFGESNDLFVELKRVL